ncbi:MAG: hypothetical protein RIR26_28, partial [Pseudomonadota bacterium]
MQMSQSLKWRILGRACLLFCLGPMQLAKAETAGLVKPAERINRSVLTVGREVYSAGDAAALLLVWNLTQPSA